MYFMEIGNEILIRRLVTNYSKMTSLGNTSDITNPRAYLQSLNAQFAAVVLPAVVVLGVLMVTGAVGNVIVLYVYTWRMKAGTITRYIQALAVFDLFSCCLAIPGEIIDMTNNYTFGANPLCQTVRTINLFCTMASGSILIVVAIDRYKRICCPLKRQITPRCALVIIVLCAGIALFFSLPTAVMFGGRTITTDVPNINGTDCSVNDRYVTTILPLAYSSVQMFLFLVGAIILIVLYTLIAKRIFHHAHLRQRRRSSVIIGRSKPLGASTSVCSSPTPDNNDQQFNIFSYSNNNNNSDFRPNLSSGQEDPKSMDVVQMKTSNILDNIKCAGNSKVIDHDQLVRAGKEIQNIPSLCELNATDEPNRTISKTLTDSEEAHKIDGAVMDNDRWMNRGTCYDDNIIKIPRLVLLRRRSSLTDLKSVAQVKPDTKVGLASKSFQVLQDGFLPFEDNLGAADHISKPTDHIHKPTDHIPKPTDLISEDSFLQTSSQTLPYKLAHTSPHTSPPATPIEDLDNPKRWLLTSHCHNGDLLWNQSRAAPGSQSLHSNGAGSKIDSRLIFSNITNHSETNKIDKRLFNERTNDSNKMFEIVQINKVTGCDKVKITRHSFMTGASKQAFESRKIVGFNYAINRQSSEERISGGQESKLLTTRNKPVLSSSFRRVADLKSVQTRSDTQGTRRTTLMLFSITLIYILSFLPHLVLMTLKALGLDTHKLHGEAGELLLNLLIRSYFINSASNPIIYSFFSNNFFKECKKFLICFRHKQ
ncbi:unnamed protein product [Lymnaea stagnalis]|uniref:G-protein coupled receptors family 1 profile domain-containing protein n=1 Tax=Lymnaea stagnalis TaxID=6523 RepID=A0AAV2IK49_LYMST